MKTKVVEVKGRELVEFRFGEGVTEKVNVFFREVGGGRWVLEAQATGSLVVEPVASNCVRLSLTGK